MVNDLGVAMLPGNGNEKVGPEDALAPGPKRGDYSDRVGPMGYAPHQVNTPQRANAEGTRAAVAAAIDAADDASVLVFTATFAGTVTKAVFVADADITGAATNNRKISVVNGGASGAGTTEVAAISFGASTNAVAGEATDLTLSGTAANLDVVPGDQIIWKSAKVGTGIADPGGQVFVIVEPN